MFHTFNHCKTYYIARSLAPPVLCVCVDVCRVAEEKSQTARRHQHSSVSYICISRMVIPDFSIDDDRRDCLIEYLFRPDIVSYVLFSPGYRNSICSSVVRFL